MKRTSSEHLHQLDLVPLGADRWRLCDAAGSGSDPDRLIAYVEKRGDSRYDVVWIAVPRGTQRFSSVEAIFAAAADLLRQASPVHGKPTPIPHLPPLSGRN